MYFNQRLFVESMIGLNFPNCSNAIQESKKHEVDIDYFFECKGAWLDRGEIDKIANVQSWFEEQHYRTYHRGSTEYDYDDDYYNTRR